MKTEKTSHLKPKFAMFLLVVCMFALPIISAIPSVSVYYPNGTIPYGASGLSQALNYSITNGQYCFYDYNSQNLSIPCVIGGNMSVSPFFKLGLVTGGTNPNDYGVQIIPNKNFNITTLTKNPSSTINSAYIKTDGGTIIATGVQVGNIFYFNQNLSAGVIYRLTGKNTGGQNLIGNTTAITLPYSTEYFNITNGINDGGAYNDQVWVWDNYTISSESSKNITFASPTSLIMYANDSSGVLAFNASSWNYTLFQNSITYNSQSAEGNVENFILNITSPNTLTSAYLIYNGTSYPTSVTNAGTNYIISSSFNVPSVTTQTNYSFYWQLNFGASQVNSSSYQQQVSAIAIDDCSVYTTKLLNLTALDEQTQNPMNQTIEITINLYPLNQYKNPSYVIGNLSKTFTNVTNATACLSSAILNGTNYYMDAQIRYYGNPSLYVTKLYNIQKYLVTNATAFQNIKLFDLLSASNTDFLITIKDANFLPLQGALIMIQRKYIGEGVYKNVEIPLSDKDGQAVGHFDLNSVVYQIVIVKDGVNIATFQDIAVVCTDKTIGQCYLNLNSVSGSQGFSDYNNYQNINYVLTTNRTGSSILTFNTIDGTSVLMNITSTSYGMNPIDLCSATLLSSAGQITCNMPSTFTNGTFEVDIFVNGNFLTRQIYSINIPATSSMGYEGYIYLLLLIITIPFMFITDTIAFMASLVLGFIIAGALFLYSSGSVIGTGSAVIWLIIAVGIVIYKLQERRRES